MKNHLLILTVLSLILVVQTTFSQPICGFDSRHSKMMKDPAYRKSIEGSEANIRRYIDAHRKQLEMRVDGAMAALYTIPVVVHVMHTGGAIGSIYNPTDAQITGAIDYLNQVYNGSYPGTQGVGDLQVQFVLAQRDPNCNPTNGINRINAAGISGYVSGGVNSGTALGTDELNVKNLVRWPTTDYYNIWVVNKIDANDGTSGSFVAGFAYFPSAAPSAPLYDGTIMLATQMKTGEKTLPHEIGHAFFLYHPFESPDNGTTCPPYSSTNPTIAQTTGDKVTDTDPITLPPGFLCRSTSITNNCTIDPGNPSGNVYSINTESNYMSYTNCYTVFTAGQKARMLATAASSDRLSLSTSLGGIPTTSPGNPCPPKINFELSNDQETEITVASSGCRSYKDYTYNMVIGNDPTMPATATLTVGGGSATEGVDFDITTNGSFAAPSKTLSFPAGSHGVQSFSIRVYDDAIVDPVETCMLGFTVNSGGGTAVKGDGRINFTLTISDNDIAPYGLVATTKSIGSNLGLLQSPFAGASAKQKTEIVYKVSELTAAGISAGNIIGLSMNLEKNNGTSFVYQGLTIKMGHTALNALSPVNDASFTTVYSADYTTVDGWNSFNFTTPFVWNGTSNVVVVICYDNGATTGVNDNCQVYTDGIAGSNYVWQNTINCTGSFSSWSLYNNGYKPIIQFVYADPGTQVQTTLNTSRQEYLGPNADVYFYDQATNKLMARISNSSSFNYGCTQVLIDRNITSAGANAVAFLNSPAANYLLSKTFKVIPTTNNPSGSYQISLYYTQPEINAWQTATGQNVSNIQMVKVATQIADVTPATPSGGGAITIKTPSVTTLGINTVLTASFTNGFSGFGAGVTGNAALPVHLLDFKGSLRSGAEVLDWSTSSEINSQYFDVERSYDGIIFSKVGTVNAAGNSNITQYYSFTDPVVQEHNYYRLKQVDRDGKFEYSKVILIENNNTGNVRIINNPFADVLDIEFGKLQSGKTDIRLLDVTGKEIYHTVNDLSGQSRLRVNLAGRNISAGIYLLQVITNQGQFTQRVIKR